MSPGYQAALMAHIFPRMQNKTSALTKVLEVGDDLLANAVGCRLGKQRNNSNVGTMLIYSIPSTQARKQVLCWLESSRAWMTRSTSLFDHNEKA
jgi:hypothetical protein